MVIAPSGKRRVMVAQSFSSPTAQLGHGDDDFAGITQEDVPGLDAATQLEEKVDDVEREQEAGREPQPGSDRHDLAQYIFDKLQGFGFPGRRLVEFRSKFVKQTISSDGAKQVEIVIPDSYYGAGKQISDGDFNTIVKEISHKFKLFFEGAERSDGKLVIKFTSVSTDEGNGEEFEEDELSRVYGNPGQNLHPDKQAYTIHEMIKNGKFSMVDSLLNLMHGVT